MTEPCLIGLRRGGLHFDQAVYERHFSGLDAVVMLRDGPSLLILPVRHQAAGGTFIKQRNKAGDRVIEAAEFLRANGVEDDVEKNFMAVWSDRRAGLILNDVFQDN